MEEYKKCISSGPFNIQFDREHSPLGCCGLTCLKEFKIEVAGWGEEVRGMVRSQLEEKRQDYTLGKFLHEEGHISYFMSQLKSPRMTIMVDYCNPHAYLPSDLGFGYEPFETGYDTKWFMEAIAAHPGLYGPSTLSHATVNPNQPQSMLRTLTWSPIIMEAHNWNTGIPGVFNRYRGKKKLASVAQEWVKEQDSKTLYVRGS